MDIKSRIKTADKFCASEGELFAAELADSPNTLQLFIADFIGDDLRFRQRASWVMIALAKKHDTILAPYLPLLVNTLIKSKEDSIKRNLLRLFQYVTPPEQYHEELVNYCFDLLTDHKEAIAIQVFAMTVLQELIIEYPELERELTLIIEEKLPFASAGYKARAKKILSKYNKKR